MLHIINSNVQNLKIDGMIKDNIFCEGFCLYAKQHSISFLKGQSVNVKMQKKYFMPIYIGQLLDRIIFYY